ncbi:MAG: spore germination protein, partial [Oscillospiraceae bacterium]|nr:spore germination protein [Oscillospiraceae bacterium]
MERRYAAELNDRNLSAIFENCDDFIRRELRVDGQTVYAYALDGMVASGFLSDYILKPLAQGQVTGSPQEQFRRALSGAVYNAVADGVSDLQTAAEKLVNGFCVLWFPGGGAVAYEVRSPVRRSPSPPEVENTVKGAKDAFTETIRIN